nr:toprim domain-containing protein [uncultured Cohaesibacter sp.]
MASRLQEVKAALQDDVLRLVKELVPDGKATGNNYTAKSPVRHDRRAGSFVVWIGGNAKGAFKDYADDDVKGDIFGLICLCKGLDKKEALAWAEDWLGWKTMSKAEKAKFMREVKKREARQKEDDLAFQRRMVDRARRTWSTTVPIIGTVGEEYFRYRGVPLDQIKHRVSFCRFLPACEYWYEAEYRYEGKKKIKVKAGRKFPAIVSAMRDIEGQLQALHYTFLALDGRGKAPVADPSKAKLMYPRTTGAAIWLTRGKGNMDAKTMADKGLVCPVIVGEGIEDGLSAALAVPEARVLAAGSLPNLLHLPLHPCFGSMLLLKDNDWNKPQAQELFDKAMDRIKRHGLPVASVSSSSGKDFNDLLRGE